MAVVLQAGARVTAAFAGADRLVPSGSTKAEHQCNRLSCFKPRAVGGAQKSIGVVVETVQRKQRSCIIVKAAGEGVETGVEVEVKSPGDVLPSDQWPDTFSLLNFEDLSAHYEPILFKAEAQPETYLADVMSKTIYTAFPEQSLSEIDHFFKDISGVPVVDQEYKVIGVLSRKDRAKASTGDSKVSEVMTTPAITLSADKTVKDAAVLMLKNKIHRIPIVNSTYQVVGIVTRTDIFTALEH